MVKHSLLRDSPIKVVDVNEELTVEAAKLKLKHYNVLSLADCYLMALARLNKATVVTTDHNIKNVGEVPTELLSF